MSFPTPHPNTIALAPFRELRTTYFKRLEDGEIYQDLFDELKEVADMAADPLTRRHVMETIFMLRKRAVSKINSRSVEAQYIRFHGRPSQVLNYLRSHGAGRGANIPKGYLEQLWDEQQGRCKLTNIPMTLSKLKGRPAPFNPAVDCIIPKSEPTSPGYAIGNVRLICDVINSFREKLPDETMHIVLQKIVEHYPTTGNYHLDIAMAKCGL